MEGCHSMDTSDELGETEHRAIVRRLVDDWYAHRTAGGTFVMRRKNRKTHEAQFAMVYAFAAQAHATALAFLAAVDVAPPIVASPLARAIFEHALTAQWLAQVPDAYQAMGAEEARQRRNLATTLRRTAIDAYLEAADKVTPSRLDELESASLAGARNFEALCGDLVPGKDQAYSIYRILSMEAHPTLLVADQWFAPAREGSTARATLLVRPHELESPWTPVVASSLVWAGRAFDYFDGSHARRSLLRSTARALGIPEELKESPESQKRRAEADRQRRKAKQAAASGSNSERPS